MTQKNGDRRLSATEYLKILQGISTGSTDENNANTADAGNQTESAETTPSAPAPAPNPTFAVLPSYFEKCIYPLYLKLHYQGTTPDDRIVILTEVRKFSCWIA
jgi:hypothetical protein